MTLTVKKKPTGTAQLSVVHKEGPEMQVTTEQHSQEEVPLPATAETSHEAPHAMIGVSTSLTINLGKFNSVKVGCELTLPSALNELDDVFEYGRSWVNSKMEQMAADVTPDNTAED